MTRVAIVEDEEESARRLEEILKRYQDEFGTEFRISRFLDGIDFVDGYSADYDIVFMDIDMPHMNGMEAAKLMRECDPNVALIFVTNLAKYAIKGYDVGASGFLVKPLDYNTFCLRAGKEIERLKERDEPYLLVNSRVGKAKVLYSSICYITVHGRYVLLHMKNGVQELHVSMKELEPILSGHGFVRGDNSSMVNLKYVTEVNMEGAIVNGELIPCSRNRRKALLDAFTLYLR